MSVEEVTTALSPTVLRTGCLQLLEVVNSPPQQRAAAWDSGGAAANFAAVVPPLLASPALSGALASDVGFWTMSRSRRLLLASTCLQPAWQL